MLSLPTEQELCTWALEPTPRRGLAECRVELNERVRARKLFQGTVLIPRASVRDGSNCLNAHAYLVRFCKERGVKVFEPHYVRVPASYYTAASLTHAQLLYLVRQEYTAQHVHPTSRYRREGVELAVTYCRTYRIKQPKWLQQLVAAYVREELLK